MSAINPQTGVIQPSMIIVGSLTLVAGLAWNDAFSESIKYYYPLETKSSLRARFLYALVVTVVVLIIAYLIVLVNTITQQVYNTGVTVLETIPKTTDTKHAVLL